MNHKKRLFKQRMRRVKEYKIFFDYLNNNLRSHIIFKMVGEGDILVDRIIKKKDFLVVKAHYTKTKLKILMTVSKNNHAHAIIE